MYVYVHHFAFNNTYVRHHLLHTRYQVLNMHEPGL
jgi:hypothetical protein